MVWSSSACHLGTNPPPTGGEKIKSTRVRCREKEPRSWPVSTKASNSMGKYNLQVSVDSYLTVPETP